MLVLLCGITIVFTAYDAWTNKSTGVFQGMYVLVLTLALALLAAAAIEFNTEHIVKQIEVKACLKDKGKL